MTDMIPEFLVDEPDADDPPVQFKLTYTIGGEKQSEAFAALPAAHVPYWWTVDYFAAGEGDLSAQSAATVTFFDRVLLRTDHTKDSKSSHDRFLTLVRDPAVNVHGKVLQQVIVYLMAEYHRADPTRARSAGRSSSRSGAKRTSRGSTARASARGST